LPDRFLIDPCSPKLNTKFGSRSNNLQIVAKFGNDPDNWWITSLFQKSATDLKLTAMTS